MKTIEYVGYSLMIVAYTILLIKNLEFKVGLIVSISTIIAVFILKYLLINKKIMILNIKNQLFNNR